MVVVVGEALPSVRSCPQHVWRNLRTNLRASNKTSNMAHSRTFAGTKILVLQGRGRETEGHSGASGPFFL